jgi:hypothetical protein
VAGEECGALESVKAASGEIFKDKFDGNKSDL